jgi:O-antigen chain-terminating methyltransferase
VHLNLDSEFKGFFRYLRNAVVRGQIRQIEPYHPLSVNGKLIASGERGCSDRWTVIREVISQSPGPVLDLGCAEGYYVRRIAGELGCLALGVDADLRRLTIAQDLSLLNKSERAGFVYARLTPEFLATLPVFDTVIFLSVLHHVMYEHGEDYARNFLKIIRSKTARSLVFEMGQSNETEREWAPLLPNMGADPHEWIAAFLHSCGFSQVTKAAQTDSYKGTVRRALFVARP